MNWILMFVTLIFVSMVALPFVRSDYWTFRMLEYPRLQKLALGLFIAGLVVWGRHQLDAWFWWTLLPLLAAIVYLVVKIFPYTVFARKEMLRVQPASKNGRIRLMTANVLQDNKDYSRLLQLVKDTDPDVIFLLETDKGWENGVADLEKTYPYNIKQALDNTYGLLFYSRLPLRQSQVLFRAEPDIPSIKTQVQLPGGNWVQLYGLHPKPPVPEESLTSTAKDKELMKVALEVEKLSMPCVVMGDLNDVAWSHTTELFRKVSRLLDPRRGRGFYSTFSAHHWWLRFPLDYIFCSSDFGLISMRRLPPFGSDHYAMFIELQYEPRLEAVHEEPEANQSEEQEAKEKAVKDVS